MKPERILVVDDKAAVREFIADSVLKPAGYHVLVARDGLQALEMVRQHNPDLMLLDLQMPELDGMGVLDQLRREQLDVPVILMTAHGSEEIAVEVFRKGVKDYIIKTSGFNLDEFLASVERSLEQVRLRKAKDQLTERLLIANTKLNQRLRELRILYSIGKSVTALMDMDGLMRRVVGAATILTSSEEGGIYVLEDDQLVCKALKRREDERPLPINRTMHEPIALQSIEGRQPVMFKGHNGQNGLAAALATPLMVADKTLGALVVKNISPQSRAFNEHDTELLCALSDYAAIAYRSQGHIREEDRAAIRRAIRSKSIFVSYSRNDWEGVVSPLVDQLRGEGMNVWIDQHLLEGGQDWLDKIGQALEECGVMVLCISPQALESIYVKMEYRYFIHERKPLLPVIFKEVRLPAELIGIQNFRHNQLAQLVERLHQVLGN